METKREMSEKIWSLLRLKADSEEELIEKYRQVYIDEYVNQEVYDFRGTRVIFPYKQFDHAFSESSNYKTSLGLHDRFSKKRARYILWIKKVLMADNGNVEYCFEHRSETRSKRGRQVVARIYAIVEEKYIVVLDKKGDKLYFITGVPHNVNSYKSMIRRSVLLSQKKVPSTLGD